MYADVMQKLAVAQQYPPSVSLQPHSKENSLCVSAKSLHWSPVVKLSKPVCCAEEMS